jgi:hypothetical protein
MRILTVSMGLFCSLYSFEVVQKFSTVRIIISRYISKLNSFTTFSVYKGCPALDKGTECV